MIPTIPHNPEDPAETAAVQTPDGEPDAGLLDPEMVHGHNGDDSEEVLPA